MHGVSARLGKRRGQVKDTCSAALGWNTCNPSVLLGFAFCWHIYFKRPPFFISLAQLAHTHTPMNHTHERTHVSCHDYSHSFHHKTLLFSPCFKPFKLLCCVLHRFTHMLCQFELFFYVFRLQCFHWPIILPLSQLFLLCLYSDSFSLCLVLYMCKYSITFNFY